MPSQARREAVSSARLGPPGLRCDRRAALAWPETAPNGRLSHIKPRAHRSATGPSPARWRPPRSPSRSR